MKTSPRLFYNSYFTITENTIFYPFCALIGIPIVWEISSIFVPSMSPIWGLSCYILFLDSNIKIYANRAKDILRILWISTLFAFITFMLIKNNFLQTIIALLGYVIYKNSHSKKLGIYVMGFINITIITSSPTLGVVGKETIEGMIQILKLSGEALVGFLSSLVVLVFYYIIRSMILFIRRGGGKHSKKAAS